MHPSYESKPSIQGRKKVKKEKNIPVEEPQPLPENEVSETPKTQPEAPKVDKKTKITKVGAMLKEVRMQKDLKLIDVAKQLCIRKHYLESIEDSAYSDIPPFPYGIGFIRSYAKFLGLNAENIVDLYKEETHISEPANMHVLEPQAEANVPNLRYIIISIVAIVLLCIGWLAYNRVAVPTNDFSSEYGDNSNSGGVIIVEEFNADQIAPKAESIAQEQIDPEDSLQITVTDEVYQEPEVTETEKVEPAEKTQSTEESLTENSAEPVVDGPVVVPNTGVFIEVLTESWVEIKDDTKLYLSKVLQPGETYTVPEGAGMILSVGKPDGVKVYINGVETDVVRPNKKMNIALDEFLNTNH